MEISSILTSFRTFCEIIIKKKWVRRSNILMTQQTYVNGIIKRLAKGKREHTKKPD